MIPFNKAPFVGTELEYVRAAIDGGQLAGDGRFSRRCEAWLESRLGCERALLTPSCTAALELAALLIGIEPGDEVILPSFTFVSTANAFALRGARTVFVDIEPRTLNIDPECVRAAITPRTRAIVAVHYAGVSCDMDALMELAEARNLWVVEDAAQALGSRWRGQPVGARGHLAAFSFHATKNHTAGGEGGALAINRPEWVARAEVLRDKGTDRARFFRGQVDKYSWQDLGSSYLLSEIQAAYLFAQLEADERIRADRMATWTLYHERLQGLDGVARLPDVPAECEHNAHLFHVRCQDLGHRTRVLRRLSEEGVDAVFHYVPLHSAPAGRRLGRFAGEDRHTTATSETLLRLPLWFGMGATERDQVVAATRAALIEEAGTDHSGVASA